MTILTPIQRSIDALAAETGYPAEAVEACVARPDASAPVLRAILQRAARGMRLIEAEAAQLFLGIHILAKLRDAQSFVPLMRLLRRPIAEVEDLLGDAVTQTLPNVLAGVFDGDADAIFDGILDLSLDQNIRDGLFRTATILTIEGRIDRERMRTFLLRFDEERLTPKGDVAWIGWIDAIAHLGFTDVAAGVGAVWIDQRIMPETITRRDFDKALAEAVRGPDDVKRLKKAGLQPIDDVAEALAWADWTGPPEPVVNPMRDVGRNDPCPCGSGKKAKKCCLRAIG